MRNQIKNEAKVAIVLIAIGIAIVASDGCNHPPPIDTEPPDTLFKAIVDEKKQQLAELLVAKESELLFFRATIVPETDVDKRMEWTHVGTIKFRYAIEKPRGENEATLVNGVVAVYWLSRQSKTWHFRHCGIETDSSFGGGSALVDFSDVKRVFED